MDFQKQVSFGQALNISSTYPSIDTFRTFATHIKNQNKVIEKNCLDKSQIKAASSTRFSYISGSTQTIVNDFKQALIKEYGKEIAEFAFPQEDQKKAIWSGLKTRTIQRVLANADEEYLKVARNELPAYAMVAQVKAEVVQKISTIIQQVAHQFPHNQQIQEASKAATEVNNKAQLANKQVIAYVNSVKNSDLWQIAHLNISLNSKGIKEVFSVVQTQVSLATQAAEYAAFLSESIELLAHNDPQLAQALQDYSNTQVETTENNIKNSSSEPALQQQLAVHQAAQDARAIANIAAVQVANAPARIAEITENLQKTLSEINATTQLAIKNALTAISNRQSLTVIRGMTGALFSDFETQKKQAIQKAKQQKKQTEYNAVFNALQESIVHEDDIVQCILTERVAQAKEAVASHATFIENIDIDLAQEIFIKAKEAETAAITFFNEDLQASKDLALEILIAAREAKIIATGGNAQEKITTAKTQLQKLMQQLEAIDSNTLSPQQEKLKQATASVLSTAAEKFQLAEISFSETALVTAKKISQELENYSEIMIRNAAKEKQESPLANNSSLLARDAQMSLSVAKILQDAANAYDLIAQGKCVEFAMSRISETVTTLQESSQDKQHDCVAIASAALDQVVTIARRNRASEITLETIPHLNDTPPSCITGCNGRIFLTPLPLSLTDITAENRKSYLYGTNLIRYAMFNKFGLSGVTRFDQEFAPKIASQNPLSTAELKSFLNQVEEVFGNRYRIIAPTSLHNLRVQLSHVEENKIIQAADTSVFNPFLPATRATLDSSSTSLSSPNQTQTEYKEGIKAAQEAILSTFDVETQAEEIKKITEQFNAIFANKITSGTPLTVSELISFLDKIIEDQSSFNYSYEQTVRYMRSGRAAQDFLSSSNWHLTGPTLMAILEMSAGTPPVTTSVLHNIMTVTAIGLSELMAFGIGRTVGMSATQH